MPSVQSLIDGLCAAFTTDSLFGLVRKRVARGPATLGDIAVDITGVDRSLDIASARTLAEGAVTELSQKGDLVMKGELVQRTR